MNKTCKNVLRLLARNSWEIVHRPNRYSPRPHWLEPMGLMAPGKVWFALTRKSTLHSSTELALKQGRPQRCPSTICVLDCGASVCGRLSAQGRDIGCGSVSLQETHIEHMQRKVPYPTCGEEHCRGTLQRSTGAPASLLSLFPSCSGLGPACFGPDQVGAARMPC